MTCEGVLFTHPVGCSRLPSAVNDLPTAFFFNISYELHQFSFHCHHEILEEEDRSSPDSRWRRFIIVFAVRKSVRSFIGAFLPDFFSDIYQFFLYLSYSSEDGQLEWSSCANFCDALLLGPANFELRITID